MPSSQSRAEIRAAWNLARNAWPDVDVDLPAFAAAIARAGTPQPTPHSADLYLAVACARGDRRGIASFERRFMPKLEATLRRAGMTSDVATEVIASVRERLFFHPSPMIASYAGRGALGAWLRRIALRAAVKLVENDRRRTTVDDLDEVPAVERDPEIAYLSRSFGVELKAAVGEALADLGPRERTLLRRRLLGGSTLDVIANRRVHRSTASRRIAKLRESVIDDVHRRLGSRLGLTREEVLAMSSSVGEDLELSLARLLEAKKKPFA